MLPNNFQAHNNDSQLHCRPRSLMLQPSKLISGHINESCENKPAGIIINKQVINLQLTKQYSI